MEFFTASDGRRDYAQDYGRDYAREKVVKTY